MSRATVVAITNQKGGVGKTTVALHIAFALRQIGKSVLLVDMDSQGNASGVLTGDLMINKRPGGATTIFEGVSKDLRGIPTDSGIDLLHGNLELSDYDSAASGEELAAMRESIRELDYDYVVFDTPPAFSNRQVGPLLWAHYCGLVVKPAPMDLQGLTDAIVMAREIAKPLPNPNSAKTFAKEALGVETARKIEKLRATGQNPELKWKLIINRYDARVSKQSQIVESIKNRFPNHHVPQTLSERASLVECLSLSIPIWELPRVPRDVVDAWRSLPSALGII